MNNLLVAVLIGIIAGTVDVVPMIIQKLDKYACISAFVHYLILGIVIPFVNWELEPWIKGLILGELLSVPVMVLVFEKDKKALIPMSIFAAVLGIGIAIAGAKFIG